MLLTPSEKKAVTARLRIVSDRFVNLLKVKYLWDAAAFYVFEETSEPPVPPLAAWVDDIHARIEREVKAATGLVVKLPRTLTRV